MHAIIKTAHQNSFRNKLNNSHYSYIQGRHHAKGTKKKHSIKLNNAQQTSK